MEHLRRPLVIHPDGKHTHTVIFVHSFKSDSSDHEIRSKLLSGKMSKDHMALKLKFPSIRWLFPYAGKHLSPEDTAELQLNTKNDALLYITRIILQEAELVGGLNKVILGGQGETAFTAHEAMRSFTQPEPEVRENPHKLKEFIQGNFHNTEWSEIKDLTLGGFIGMYAEGGRVTRHEKEYGVMGRFASAIKVNEMIVKNTPHCFIHGGYKTQTATWDGRRIDEVETFLKSLGIGTTIIAKAIKTELGDYDPLTPRSRLDPKDKKSEKDPRSEVDKHLELVKKQKAADAEARKRIMMRIECDKSDRRARQQREVEARRAKQDRVDPDDEDEDEEHAADRAEVKRRKLVREQREKPWMKWPSRTLADYEAGEASRDIKE
ncbi:hypothetical protein F5Y10DRAFT_258940 [Nemania abortiva]|nr:hypothetical protein F5Y10DRAFT_258940 [Nemania abortiva]